ncbi:MAG: DUF4188 domain-containing protein [Xanthobacteraceae bacterium]
MAVDRRTVDLAAYPDLVMILLGMRVNTATGLKTLLGFGPLITKAARDLPDGLLSHETFLWSLFPPHAGIRQYWRDFEALEAWSRSEPHRAWWKNFLRDTGGTGFWHESYFMKGGVEAVFDDMPQPIGLLRFAPIRPAKGGMFTARQRAAATNAASFGGRPAPAPVVTEREAGGDA